MATFDWTSLLFSQALKKELNDNSVIEVDILEREGFELDMLYVECQKCGRPIIWDRGKTSQLLLASGINLTYLNWDCLILSDGCAACSPDKLDGFSLSVVKLAGLTPEEAMYLSHPQGSA